MAKPIQLDISPRDHKAELEQRLAAVPSEHAAALLDFVELIEEMHRQNVLSTLRGAIGASGTLVTHVSRGAVQPESIRAMRNALALMKLLGQIDPELIEAVQRSIPPALRDRGLRRNEKPPSLWQIARTFWSPAVRRTLMATGFVLAGVGYYLNKETPSMADEA